MLLGAVMQATNNKPPGTIPSKGNYIAKDLELWSQHYGIPFRMNSIFPQNTLKALRLAIVCQQENCFQMVHQALFEAMFVHNLDISDVDILKNLINQQQLNSDQLIEKLSENTIKDELKRNTNEAISRGAFGAPTFFINDDHDLTSGELYELIFQVYWSKRGLIPLPTLWLKYLGDLGSTLERIFSARIFINKKVIARLLNESRFSSELFSQEYDWTPPYEPKQGIAETVEWYRGQRKIQ